MQTWSNPTHHPREESAAKRDLNSNHAIQPVNDTEQALAWTRRYPISYQRSCSNKHSRETDAGVKHNSAAVAQGQVALCPSMSHDGAVVRTPVHSSRMLDTPEFRGTVPHPDRARPTSGQLTKKYG
jgi:hypothetical protein